MEGKATVLADKKVTPHTYLQLLFRRQLQVEWQGSVSCSSLAATTNGNYMHISAVRLWSLYSLQFETLAAPCRIGRLTYVETHPWTLVRLRIEHLQFDVVVRSSQEEYH